MSRAANSLIVRHYFLVRYGCRTMKEQNDDKRVNTFSYVDMLDPEQSAVLEHILNSNDNVLITGKAGTGKSFLLHALLECADGKTLQMAPTGVAALNINGVTLHSAFGFNNLEGIDVDDISRSTLRLRKEKHSVLIAATRIVIDEASMIRSDTFEKMDRILQVICRDNRPFGGKQIVLFGDLFQLPPVVKRNEEFDLIERFGGIHFFETTSYEQGCFAFVELSTNHRQAEDAPYFEMLNRIRTGQASDEDLASLNARASNENDYAWDGTVRLFPMKKDADSFNSYVLSQIKSEEYKFMANVWSRNKQPVKMIEKRFPITQCLRLKVGAQVMMITNDPQKRWANGTMGVVERIERREAATDSSGKSATGKGPLEITVRFGDKAYVINKATFTEDEAIERNGSIEYEPAVEVKQYPMVLAWAMTIHKSQSLTYGSVTCSLEGCFSPGQAYVALSRCRSLDGLRLTGNVALSDLIVDQEAVDFYNRQFMDGSLEEGGSCRRRRKSVTEVLIEKSILLRTSDACEADALLHRALGREDASEALANVARDISQDNVDLSGNLLALANCINAVKR